MESTYLRSFPLLKARPSVISHLNPNPFLKPHSLIPRFTFKTLKPSCSRNPLTQITNNAPEPSSSSGDPKPLFGDWAPPRPLWRGLSVPFLTGQVIYRTLMGRVHRPNTVQQLERVGPRSLGVCLLTASFVGMAFTIQFVREFTRLGLHRSVGGVLALAFARELSPVVTAVVVAGRVGSAYAAELGTMQVDIASYILIGWNWST